jgi:hypothetical protein
MTRSPLIVVSSFIKTLGNEFGLFQYDTPGSFSDLSEVRLLDFCQISQRPQAPGSLWIMQLPPDPGSLRIMQ